MTVQEISEKKKILEKKLTDLCNEFAKDCNEPTLFFSVSSVWDPQFGDKPPVFNSIQVDAKLNIE